jgi:hypothetical protein
MGKRRIGVQAGYISARNDPVILVPELAALFRKAGS